MTDHLEPFIRVDDGTNTTTDTAEIKFRTHRVLRFMRVHFWLASFVFFLGFLAVLGSLYSQFDKVTISRRLGLEGVRDAYAPDTQEKLLVVLGLAALSLLCRQATNLLRQQQHGAVIWSLGASMVLVVGGVGAGVVLWQQAGTLDSQTGMLTEVLADLPWVVHGLALALIVQAVFAGWYLVRLAGRGLRAQVEANGPGQLWRGRLPKTLLVVALVLAFGSGMVLGVGTNWIYELPVGEIDAGVVVYATTFDDFTDDWDTFLGRDEARMQGASDIDVPAENEQTSAIAGQTLVISHGSPVGGGIVWSALDRTVRDFDVRATAQQIEGAYDQNQYGVIFRYRDESNFYIFRITSDGYYSLAKVQDGFEEKISDWGISSSIRLSDGDPARPETLVHRANELGVTGKDGQFRFWVNGEAVPLCLRGENNVSMWLGTECYTSDLTYVYKDDDFAQGQIALAAGTLDGSPVAVAFDDLVIVGPAPERIEANTED